MSTNLWNIFTDIVVQRHRLLKGMKKVRNSVGNVNLDRYKIRGENGGKGGGLRMRASFRLSRFVEEVRGRDLAFKDIFDNVEFSELFE